MRGGYGVRVWRLEVEYEGTRYGGWQRQPHARTVQGELERAAAEVFGAGAEVGGSGRTDAGVHALGQVAHLKLKGRAKGGERQPSARQLQSAMNQLLPHDINVLRVSAAAPDFHARHDAVARYYLYQISTRRTAFAKPFVWWVRDRLDAAAMARACALFGGTRDFSSFCESPETQRSTLVRVERAEVFARGGLILFRVGASHFLWKMVRRLVGALVEVGRGNLTVDGLGALLERYSNAPAAWTAPPSGLFLERVLYEGDKLPDAADAFHFNFSGG
ncbi:MAG TPA: tRNA pseudouridine(38-40) synthase TruA [Pyrinomonadaceae bacterium]|nr:tRNA pseudouridine(38-40) synthase TruA [Pyrinomonadaceae bacterium]